MTKDSDAAWYAREMLSVLALGGLVFAGWWLERFGASSGVGNVDAARRVVGVLIGVYLIADGNRTPKLRLTASSEPDAAQVQRFQRFTAWSWVVAGTSCVLSWLMLPVNLAQQVSMVVVFTGFVIFSSQMLLVVRGVRQMKGSRS